MLSKYLALLDSSCVWSLKGTGLSSSKSKNREMCMGAKYHPGYTAKIAKIKTSLGSSDP